MSCGEELVRAVVDMAAREGPPSLAAALAAMPAWGVEAAIGRALAAEMPTQNQSALAALFRAAERTRAVPSRKRGGRDRDAAVDVAFGNLSLQSQSPSPATAQLLSALSSLKMDDIAMPPTKRQRH
eukprot:m51a1_g13604 hypothetical protein (126) ;mRNA; r:1126-1654